MKRGKYRHASPMRYDGHMGKRAKPKWTKGGFLMEMLPAVALSFLMGSLPLYIAGFYLLYSGLRNPDFFLRFDAFGALALGTIWALLGIVSLIYFRALRRRKNAKGFPMEPTGNPSHSD